MMQLAWALCVVLGIQLYIRRTYSLIVYSPFGAPDAAPYWTTEATIGTQKFNLIVDTGSSDTWVYDKGVSYNPGVRPVPHNEYACVKGPTSNCSYAGIFHVSYGGISSVQVAGNVTWDTVTISGSTVAAMGVEQTYQAGDLAGWSPDGILGLSFGINNNAVPKQQTFMERLMPTLPAPVFGVEFVSTPTQKVANVEFGFINQTKARAGLVTVPVKRPTWMLDGVSFSIAKNLKSSPVTDSGKPITMSLMFDTGGGPQMALEPRITQAYYAQVVGAKATDSSNTAYKFPCDAILPDVLLNFATGGTVGISGYSLSFNNPNADNMCTGPISSTGVTQGNARNDAIGGVGALFFQSKYVVFNMGPVPSMSFAIWNGTAEYLNPALVP
ncbi:hypothetical protein N7G274_006285 [Stereocaulon virgatum]|uniref:Peptidase A1 domain-containing protein n=1 Tax=Stereocaulon virgatum TaxID=373712 RepID=A0ABR4A4I7_9LECA